MKERLLFVVAFLQYLNVLTAAFSVVLAERLQFTDLNLIEMRGDSANDLAPVSLDDSNAYEIARIESRPGLEFIAKITNSFASDAFQIIATSNVES